MSIYKSFKGLAEFYPSHEDTLFGKVLSNGRHFSIYIRERKTGKRYPLVSTSASRIEYITRNMHVVFRVRNGKVILCKINDEFKYIPTAPAYPKSLAKQIIDSQQFHKEKHRSQRFIQKYPNVPTQNRRDTYSD
jgi:hypothetical protein